MKRVMLERQIDDKLTALSRSRRERGEPVWSKKAVVAELIIAAHKTEIQAQGHGD